MDVLARNPQSGLRRLQVWIGLERRLDEGGQCLRMEQLPPFAWKVEAAVEPLRLTTGTAR